MRTIAIFNRKGGTGKTVTTLNMAANLAALPSIDGGDNRVLVIDADSQYDATRFFGFDPEKCTNMADLILQREDDPELFIYETGVDGVSLLPGSSELDVADVKGADNILCIAELLDVFRETARELQEAPPFDYVLIDCPPNYSEACKAALYAADEVVIPVSMGKFSIEGMADVVVQISNIAEATA